MAAVASTLLTARMITIQSSVRLPFLMPVEVKGGTTVKYCHTLPCKPAVANSSRRIASLSRTASSRSRVIAPTQRTPRPGPGKG